MRFRVRGILFFEYWFQFEKGGSTCSQASFYSEKQLDFIRLCP